MNGRNRPQINLASQPLRNRRFYKAALGAFIGLFLLIALPAGYWLLRASSRAASDGAAAVARDAELYSADRVRVETGRQVEDLQAKDRELVKQVNAVIARKGFSLVDFLALLEDALPAGSYITLMSPLAVNEERIDVRFKVVTGGLPGLMDLLAKLETLKFKNVTMKGEAQLGGQLVAEIGLTYERAR